MERRDRGMSSEVLHGSWKGEGRRSAGGVRPYGRRLTLSRAPDRACRTTSTDHGEGPATSGEEAVDGGAGSVQQVTDYRAIATDLDGTLLRTDKSVSPRTRAAVLAAEDAGMMVVIANRASPAVDRSGGRAAG